MSFDPTKPVYPGYTQYMQIQNASTVVTPIKLKDVTLAPGVDPNNILQLPSIPKDVMASMVSTMTTTTITPIPPKAVSEETQNLISKVCALTESILQRHIERPSPYSPESSPDSPESSPEIKPPTVQPNNDTFSSDYTRSGFFSNFLLMFPRFNKTVVHHHYHQHEKNKEENNNVLIGLISAVGTFAMGYFLGKAASESKKVQKEASSFNDLKVKWENNKKYYKDEYQSILNEILKNVDAILQRKRANNVYNLALLTFGLIGGVTGFAGAIIASKVVIATASVIGLTVGTLALFKLGFSLSNTDDKDDAEVIAKKLEELKDYPIPTLNPIPTLYPILEENNV